MAERKAFKEYFDSALIRHLADRLAAAEPRFARSRFLRTAGRGLDCLESWSGEDHPATPQAERTNHW